MRVEGGGGVGKSFLIAAIRTSITKAELLVTATTGKASSLIDGKTIHLVIRFKGDKTFKRGFAGVVPIVSGLKEFQTEMAPVSYIIID
jgi:hypothetical protein